MKSYSNDALGFVETVGMVPAVYAIDKMLKAASVELVSYENIGSTLVAMMIRGDVGAVKTAVAAGAQAAAEIGNLTAQNVIPRPIKEVGDIVKIYDVTGESEIKYEALGFVEAFGIVYIIQAADAMVKAASVKLLGFENTASGYISVVVEGDVGACKTAVQAGVEAISNMGKEAYSSIVIASPHRDISKILDRYTLDKLL